MAVFSSAKVIPVNGSRRMRIAPILKACTALLMLVALDQTLAFFRASQIRYMHDEVAQLLEAQSLRLTELNSLKARAGSSRKEIAQLRLDEGKIQEQMQQSLQSQQVENQKPTMPLVEDVRTSMFKRNSVVIAEPFCKTWNQTRKTGLPKFVFVAGIEGSGHHALRAVWEAVKKRTKLQLVVYDQVFHSLGIENHASYHYSSIRLDNHFQNMKKMFSHKGGLVIDTQNSYPMGKFAGAMAHPDLLFMSELDGVLFDLRVIILTRNPTDAVLSAVRRFQVDDDEESLYRNYQFQARMAAENLAHINNAMPFLPCKRYMTMEFEAFLANPRQFVGPLSRMLQVGKSYFDDALKAVEKHPKKPDSPAVAQMRKELDKFFRIQRATWPLLA